jgi:hypothetical protein
MDQVSIKYTNILQCRTLRKFTQIWIFGLKTNHLATLVESVVRRRFENDKSLFLGRLQTTASIQSLHFLQAATALVAAWEGVGEVH